MLARANAVIARRPVLAASSTLGAKYLVADVMVQQTKRSEQGFQTDRAALFGGFGFYYGAVNYHVFRQMDRIPWGGARRAAIGMSLLDIFVHLPGLFFPQFYAVRACIFADPRPTTSAKVAECAWSGLLTYRDNFVEDLKTLIMVFTPIDLAMFSLPLHLRTPFLSVVGLTFPIVLSWMRGERKVAEPKSKA